MVWRYIVWYEDSSTVIGTGLHPLLFHRFIRDHDGQSAINPEYGLSSALIEDKSMMLRLNLKFV